MEEKILFWSLIVTIVSVLFSVIQNIVQTFQNASINTVNLFQERLRSAFDDYLINDFCDLIANCGYLASDGKPLTDYSKVSFDNYYLVETQQRIKGFLSDIGYLRFAIPIRYGLLKIIGLDFVYFIDEQMIPFSILSKGKVIDDSNDKNLSIRKARNIKKTFMRKLSRFYTHAFWIYKYGL